MPRCITVSYTAQGETLRYGVIQRHSESYSGNFSDITNRINPPRASRFWPKGGVAAQPNSAVTEHHAVRVRRACYGASPTQ
jgi:hypothetical protein